jgi:hypothetical protein
MKRTSIRAGRQRTVGALLAVLLCAPVASAWQGTPEPVAFEVEELLMFPRTDGVTLSVVPAEAAELVLRYGHSTPPFETPITSVAAGERAEFVLHGLPAGLQASYRLLARRPGEAEFQARAPGSFRTLPEPGGVVRFAMLADTHAYAQWAHDSPLPDDGFGVMLATMQNMVDDEALDFMVLGGDFAMTDCGAACTEVPGGGSGNVTTVEEALFRYRKTFSPEVLGPLFGRLPFVAVLGNHEGEAGFEDLALVCQEGNPVLTFSRTAREQTLPHAPHGDDRAGGYFAFEAGDALIVVLDIMRHNIRTPMTPEDWTLGTEQLVWLERTLRQSSRAWKIVFAEHLVGGAKPPNNCYWYGRGGLKATHDGTIEGTFLGEQALVHEIMKASGAQLFLSCHDHIVAFGEKRDAAGRGEGVWYMTAGKGSGVQSPWSNQDWYAELMDYDEDGVPEYLTEVTGTRAPGYVRVTVDGKHWLSVEYVQTSLTDPAANGTTLLSFMIPVAP